MTRRVHPRGCERKGAGYINWQHAGQMNSENIGYYSYMMRNSGSALLRGESSEMRKYALPSPILIHKNICRPLLRGEDLAAEFALGCGQRRDNGSVPVDANSSVIGLHHFVGQST